MTAHLGLGLAALGRPGYMTVGHALDVRDASEAGMRRAALEVLDEAWALGVRHFDTARSYGLGEQFLSEWLAMGTRPGVVVSSKWGYRYTAAWQRTAAVHEEKEHSVSRFEAQWPESAALLGRWLGVYQVHSVTPDSPALRDAALHDRLAALREQGVRLGASVTGPNQAEAIERLFSIERDGRRLFTSVQATWNLLERSAGPALSGAHDTGALVIIKEGLANGRLGPRGAPRWLTEVAESMGTSCDALALGVALAQPFADVVLSGAATPAQLQSNAQARAVRASPGLFLDRAIPPVTYWQERSRLEWS